MTKPENDADGALPQATHEGVLHLAGRAIRTYTFADGRRIVDGDDMAALLEAMNHGATISDDEAKAYARFCGRGETL